MSSLLGRFAENLFWLGRYMERAENTARILQINETYARDIAGGPDWHRVLNLYSDAERFFEAHKQADAKSVLTFYILEEKNPTSIAFAVAAARENARTVRHLISTEMWTHINVFRGTMKAMDASDIALSKLSRLTADLILTCQGFDGIIDGTFLRGEAWCFYQLGKYLERADQTTRVLDFGYESLSMTQSDAVATIQWNTLLRSLSGYHAFRGRHPARSSPSDIARFLLYDTEFPRAVALCLQRVTERLQAIEARHHAQRSDAVEHAQNALKAKLGTGPDGDLSAESLHAFLDSTQATLGKASDAIAGAYFNHS